jgi:hypothetical protein
MGKTSRVPYVEADKVADTIVGTVGAKDHNSL